MTEALSSVSAPMLSGSHNCLQIPKGVEIFVSGSRAAMMLAGRPEGMEAEVQMGTRILFCPFCGDRIGEWDSPGGDDGVG